MKPLAIDLFTGLHGWADGLVAEGFQVIGFDLEDMSAQFGQPKPPHFQLVIQDVLTLHGSQFRDAAVIVASPPCQKFSYMSMPWSLAKAKAAAIRADETGVMLADLTRLFNACFRIQREACEAAGRHIPLVVENVRGAEPWVGRARWNFGSFYLFGDVPALMPIRLGREVMKAGIAHRSNGVTNFHGHKNSGGSWFNTGSPGQKVLNQNPVHEATKKAGQNWSRFKETGEKSPQWNEGSGRKLPDGLKCGGDWFNASQPSLSRLYGSKSSARKAASAMIAKIPLALSTHIARVYKPEHSGLFS